MGRPPGNPVFRKRGPRLWIPPSLRLLAFVDHRRTWLQGGHRLGLLSEFRIELSMGNVARVGQGQRGQGLGYSTAL